MGNKTTWTGIGWYSYDACNPNLRPFSRTVEVRAEDEHQAFEFSYDALQALCDSIGVKVDFLNWYVLEKKEQ